MKQFKKLFNRIQPQMSDSLFLCSTVTGQHQLAYCAQSHLLWSPADPAKQAMCLPIVKSEQKEGFDNVNLGESQ